MIFSVLLFYSRHLLVILILLCSPMVLAGSPQLSSGISKEDTLRLSLDAAMLSASVYNAGDVFSGIPKDFKPLDKVFVNCPNSNVVCSMAIISLSPSPYKVLHVTFRGTNTKQDWVTDIKLNLITYKTYYGNSLGRVHEGFFTRGWSLIRQNLIPKLINYVTIYQPNAIIISGHSMGGAVASLMAIDLMNTDFKELRSIPVGLITFGEPRSIGKDSLSMTENIWKFRYVFGWDAVPSVPSSLNGFVHFGPKVIEMDDNVNFMPRFGFHTDEKSYSEPDYPYANSNIGDHDMINYVNSLKYFNANNYEFNVTIPW